MRRLLAALLLLVAVLTIAACGGDDEETTPAAGQDQARTEAAVPGFAPRDAGVLTVGTELPNPPFVFAQNLDEIKGGYEVDMVNAVARKLGLATVKWVNFPFNGLVAGAPCPCDFAVNGVSIFPDREEKVDFSAPYYTANQGVLVETGTTVADRAAASQLRYGVQKDSSGLFFLDTTLKPAKKPRIYDSTNAAFLALAAGQIDAVMSDVPIVLDGAKRRPGFEVTAQFATDEQYGAVLKKDSPNTPVLSKAIEALRQEGLFDRLLQKYFAEQVKIPVLE